jgi:hypothetical protein
MNMKLSENKNKARIQAIVADLHVLVGTWKAVKHY